MNILLLTLAQQLQENVGNRITPALANGLILALKKAEDAQVTAQATTKTPRTGKKTPAAPQSKDGDKP